MTDYEPGTVAVATVRGVKGVRASRYDGGWVLLDDPDAFYNDAGSAALVTDIRPLVVLDLNEQSIRRVVETLRDKGLDIIADHIEAQTKPPRIPEPGLWGVVKASTEDTPKREWVRHKDGAWIADGYPLRSVGWSSLIDPVLVREGVA